MVSDLLGARGLLPRATVLADLLGPLKEMIEWPEAGGGSEIAKAVD